MDGAGGLTAEEYVRVLRWRLENLREELVRLRASRDELTRQIADKESLAQQLQGLLRGEGVELADSRRPTATSADSIRDAAFSVVKEAGRPVHYRQICTALRDQGVEISGKDPAATLLTFITRDARLERVGRGIYGIAGQAPRPRPARQSTARKRKGGAKVV
jgi:hypothetical protein